MKLWQKLIVFPILLVIDWAPLAAWQWGAPLLTHFLWPAHDQECHDWFFHDYFWPFTGIVAVLLGILQTMDAVRIVWFSRN